MQALRELKAQILEREHANQTRDLDGRRRFNARLRQLRAGGGDPHTIDLTGGVEALKTSCATYLADDAGGDEATALTEKILKLPLPPWLIQEAVDEAKGAAATRAATAAGTAAGAATRAAAHATQRAKHANEAANEELLRRIKQKAQARYTLIYNNINTRAKAIRETSPDDTDTKYAQGQLNAIVNAIDTLERQLGVDDTYMNSPKTLKNLEGYTYKETAATYNQTKALERDNTTCVCMTWRQVLSKSGAFRERNTWYIISPVIVSGSPVKIQRFDIKRVKSIVRSDWTRITPPQSKTVEEAVMSRPGVYRCILDAIIQPPEASSEDSLPLNLNPNADLILDRCFTRLVCAAVAFGHDIPLQALITNPVFGLMD